MLKKDYLKFNPLYFMRIFLFVFIFCFSITEPISAQTNTVATILDKKNGFKEFKFGDSFYLWGKKLKYSHTEKEIKFYTYIGTCCETVFNVDLEKIQIGFFNKKIARIVLFTEVSVNYKFPYPSADYKTIKTNFQNLFKVFPNDYKGDKIFGWFCAWRGENLGLNLVNEFLQLKKIGNEYKRTSFCKITIGYLINSIDDF